MSQSLGCRNQKAWRLVFPWRRWLPHLGIVQFLKGCGFLHLPMIYGSKIAECWESAQFMTLIFLLVMTWYSIGNHASDRFKLDPWRLHFYKTSTRTPPGETFTQIRPTPISNLANGKIVHKILSFSWSRKRQHGKSIHNQSDLSVRVRLQRCMDGSSVCR